MKNLKRVIVATLLFAISLMNVTAQDVITLKNGKEIEGKITEINDIDIKYYDFGDKDQLIFTLDRALINNIAFESGKKMKEIPPTIIDENYFTGDRKNMVKLNFTGIGANSLIVSYELSLKPEYSVETNLKMPGLGIGDDDISGVGVDVGLKLKTKAIFKKRGEYRPRHLLAGGYVKPVVGVNSMKMRGVSKSFGNIGIDIGRQLVLANIFTIDAFLGYHYIVGNKANDGDNGYRSDMVRTGDLVGDSKQGVSFGVKVGMLFDVKRK